MNKERKLQSKSFVERVEEKLGIIWRLLKGDFKSSLSAKMLYLSGGLLFTLLLITTLLRFLTTALKVPIGFLLLLFTVMVIVALIRKKERTLQDYLIAIVFFFIAVIYPQLVFKSQNNLFFNTGLAAISIFLMIAVVLLWKIAKISSQVNKQRIAFISIIMLIFFIITIYSWMYSLLVIFNADGGLRFGECDNSTIPIESNANKHTFYFSAITFTTVGYGDICAQGHWFRTLAGLEAITGILSIPTFFYILSRPDGPG